MLKESAYKVRSVSVDAIISLVLGILSILSMAGAVVASYLYDGNGPAVVGLLGIGSFLLAIIGIVFGVSGLKSQDGGYLMKRIAFFLNVIPFLGAIVIYVLGWVL